MNVQSPSNSQQMPLPADIELDGNSETTTKPSSPQGGSQEVNKDVSQRYVDDPSSILDDFRSGDLPEDMLDDQWALLQIQDQIARDSLTLSLVSQMISAEHDTYRSVINNIRA